jgi:pilus assembly protein Flp/PilA
MLLDPSPVGHAEMSDAGLVGPGSHSGAEQMKTLLKWYLVFQDLKEREEGQDLVEYALLVALIALVCVSGISNVASAVNTVFSNISSSLA